MDSNDVVPPKLHTVNQGCRQILPLAKSAARKGCHTGSKHEAFLLCQNKTEKSLHRFIFIRKRSASQNSVLLKIHLGWSFTESVQPPEIPSFSLHPRKNKSYFISHWSFLLSLSHSSGKPFLCRSDSAQTDQGSVP